MKINSIRQQSDKQNFRGFEGKAAKVVTEKLGSQAANFIQKHPAFIAGLAGSSVVGQKIIMSGSEATIGPVMDIGIGKAITAAAGEHDERIKQSSKTQAIRTFSQSVGGTITGVAIRSIMIAAMTAVCMKAGECAGKEFGKLIAGDAKENLYKLTENASSWGKALGGAVSIVVMMFTNFLLDVPLVNWINKKVTNIFSPEKNKKEGGLNG